MVKNIIQYGLRENRTSRMGRFGNEVIQEQIEVMKLKKNMQSFEKDWRKEITKECVHMESPPGTKKKGG